MTEKIFANEMLSDKELENIAGGMTVVEWDTYCKKYDQAMIKAYKSGNMELYNKLVEERPFKDYPKYGQAAIEVEGKQYPYLNMKVEELPNYDLIMQIAP